MNKIPVANSLRRASAASPRNAGSPLACLLAILLASLPLPTSATSPGVVNRYANIDFDRVSGYGNYDPAALANPNVGGVDIMMDWSAVEVQKGVYNFAPADAEAAAWSNAGKSFVIVIRYTNEYPRDCNKPQNLPSWELSRIPHFCDNATGGLIPDYFDGTFKADFEAYVAAVARHFATSPYRKNLLYVRIGVGLGSEGFYLRPCRRGRPCDREHGMAQLNAWGFSPGVWKQWQEEIMAFYQAQFSYATVIYPMVALDVDPATGNPIHMDVAYWAAARGMGLGALGLRPNFGTGPAQIRPIMAYVRSHYPHTYIQFQTFVAVHDADEMAQDIEIAKELGGKTIEWYSEDVVNPAYQNLLSQWAQEAAPP